MSRLGTVDIIKLTETIQKGINLLYSDNMYLLGFSRPLSLAGWF